MSENYNATKYDVQQMRAIAAMVFFVAIAAIVGIVMVFVDEQNDSEGEQICMEQVAKIEHDGYSPDCNL